MVKRPRHVARVLATTLSIAVASSAHAVVVANWSPITAPSNGYVGQWNGSSGVAIADHWVLTAKHVGGGVGQAFNMRGQSYIADHLVAHPNFDFMLVHVNRRLPGHHRLTTNTPGYGTEVLLGGYGVTAGSFLGDGYDWAGPRGETWGRNRVGAAGAQLFLTFDAPTSPTVMPNEAIFAVNDSGAGLFVRAGDGALDLAGIAVTLTGRWGRSTYGDTAWALSLGPIIPWLNTYVRRSDPLAPAPLPVDGREPGPVPAPGAALVLGLAAGAGSIRPRRRRAAR